MARFIEKQYGYRISIDEELYLLIHIREYWTNSTASSQVCYYSVKQDLALKGTFPGKMCSLRLGLSFSGYFRDTYINYSNEVKIWITQVLQRKSCSV